MIRGMRALALVGAAGLLGVALAAAPAAVSVAVAQQSGAQAPAKPAAAPRKMDKKAGVSHRGVEIIQAALNNAGYKLEIHGRMDQATRDALKKYQAEHKLKATGRPDKATLKSLNVKSLAKWG